MLKRIATLAFVFSFAIIVIITLTSVYSPVAASAIEYMHLSAQERIDIAKMRYSEFRANPEKEFEIMLSLEYMPHDEVAALLANENNIITAYHYFEANGECVYGGYNE